MNYRNIYSNIIRHRQNTSYIGYTECHHILPRCLGGTDDKENLVNLSAKEHFICHLLLTKMYSFESIEYYKMCHAFMMMLTSSKNQSRYITSKKYSSLKEGHSIRMSMLQSGEGNSQYGSFWIYNPHTKESIKHRGEIPDGWFKGKVQNWDRFFKSLEQKRIQLSKKNEAYQKKLIIYTDLYKIYSEKGWKEVVAHGYTSTQQALVQVFKKYNLINDSNRKQGIKYGNEPKNIRVNKRRQMSINSVKCSCIMCKKVFTAKGIILHLKTHEGC